MNQTITSVTKNLVNLLYPLRCASCGQDLEASDEFSVCNICASAIKPNPKPYCTSCGRNMQNANEICGECQKAHFYFERAYSACIYEGVLKELIHAFKYKQKVSLARLFAKLMVDFIKENDEIIKGIDVVTFVPLHSKRLWEREFNQSKIFALVISNTYGLRLADIIQKTKTTKPQNELSREGRLTNLTNAFTIKGQAPLDGLKILLVDDVMTTGATLSECSKALLGSGAGTVRCLTLARGM